MKQAKIKPNIFDLAVVSKHDSVKASAYSKMADYSKPVATGMPPVGYPPIPEAGY
jgi:hypothetical protein